MVIETVVVAAVAGVMLGWNVHVMRKNGVCCPPPRTDVPPASNARSAPDGSKLRRRRHRPRARSSQDKEAEARRKSRAAVGSGSGGSSKKVVMDAVQEQQEDAKAPVGGPDLSA